MERFSYKGEWRMHLKKAIRQLYSNDFSLKQLPTTVKSLTTKALEYKVVLKNNLYVLLCIL